MASRKEEKERLRQERIAAESRGASGEKLRLYAGYAVAGLLGFAVVAGLVVVIASGGDEEGELAGVCSESNISQLSGVARDAEPDCREGTPPPPIQFGDLEEAARRANCEVRLDLDSEGNTHFTEVDKRDYADYETSPPTSGDHYGVPNETVSGAQADGAYSTTPPASRLVHALEHGRIAIHYDPQLPEEQQLALKGVLDEDPSGMMLFPNPDQPYAVSVAAWTHYIGCDSYDPLVLDVIRDFRDRFRGNGPEPVPVFLEG